jgi:hypothetical protein
VLIAWYIPKLSQILLIVSLVNCVPLSVVIRFGVPNVAMTSLIIICAVCLAFIVFVVGLIIANFVNQSTMTMMESYPCEGGKSVTKSQVIHSNGLSGVGNGFNGPCFGFLSVLCR